MGKGDDGELAFFLRGLHQVIEIGGRLGQEGPSTRFLGPAGECAHRNPGKQQNAHDGYENPFHVISFHTLQSSDTALNNSEVRQGG